MVVRHNDTRRRRIVVDPTTSGVEVGELTLEKRSTRRKTSLYRAGAERRNQWKTTDLLPKRVRAIALLVSCLVVVVLGLNLLAAYSPRWTAVLSPSSIASLQLTGSATLATWFSSFLLIVSGFASLQIYALRQHRQDDYRGSYRLWLWMAALLMFGSVNCVVDLSSVARDAFSAFQLASFANKSLSMMILIKIGLLMALVVRGSFEVRESRGSLVLMILVWFAYFSSMILQLPLFEPVIANVDPEIQKATLGNLTLFGAVFTFLATTFFARFVYMQALGLVKSRKKASQRKQAKTKTGKVTSKQSRKSEIESEESGQGKKVKTSKQIDSDETTIESGAESTTTKSSNVQTSGLKSEPSKSELKSSPIKSNNDKPNAVKPNAVKPNAVNPADQKSALKSGTVPQEDKEQDAGKNILSLNKPDPKKFKQQASQNRRAA